MADPDIWLGGATSCGRSSHSAREGSIYSFIHSGDLYSASSRDYYSEVLPVTAKEGLQREVKFGRMGHQQGTQLNMFPSISHLFLRWMPDSSGSAYGSTPDPTTAKRDSPKAAVKCIGVDPRHSVNGRPFHTI